MPVVHLKLSGYKEIEGTCAGHSSEARVIVLTVEVEGSSNRKVNVDNAGGNCCLGNHYLLWSLRYLMITMNILKTLVKRKRRKSPYLVQL